MNKITFMFPGVGSQYIGMSKSLYENFKIFKETISQASEVLQMDLADLCYSPGKKEELNKLGNAQCVLLAFSTASYRLLVQEYGIRPDYALGHSLGEYSALCAAGAIDFSTALKLVQARGSIIQEVAKSIDGTMMWVVNMDYKTVEEVCNSVPREEGEVFVSAYDSPNQVSISGLREPIMEVALELQDKGAIVFPLNFSGPFHSPLMEEARTRMETVLQEQQYAAFSFPVIANHNALPYSGAPGVVENLSRQLVSPIRWQESLAYLTKQGVTTAIEMGPKNVLKFLMQKNSSPIRIFTTDNQEDFQLIGHQLMLKEEEYLQSVARCLGAAVSTKNACFDQEKYRKNVIKPYRKLETLYRQLQDEGPPYRGRRVKEAVALLMEILENKGLSSIERESWATFAYSGKLIKE